MDLLRSYPSIGENRLEALVGGVVSDDMVYRLFDIVPGLDYCNFDRPMGEVTLMLNTVWQINNTKPFVSDDLTWIILL